MRFEPFEAEVQLRVYEEIVEHLGKRAIPTHDEHGPSSRRGRVKAKAVSKRGVLPVGLPLGQMAEGPKAKSVK